MDAMNDEEEARVSEWLSSLTAKIRAATEDTRRQMDAEHDERERRAVQRGQLEPVSTTCLQRRVGAAREELHKHDTPGKRA